jgi:hypothetical protein
MTYRQNRRFLCLIIILRGIVKTCSQLLLNSLTKRLKKKNAKRIELIKKSERTPEEEEYLAALQKQLSTALNVLYPLPMGMLDATQQQLQQLEEFYTKKENT